MPSTATSDQTAQRSARLSKLFDTFVKGFREVKTANDAKLFLEALCSQNDRVGCIERIAASKHALESLKIGLRLDVSPTFLNGSLKDFLAFLSDPIVKMPCGGDLVKQLQAIVVQPPTLWRALVAACKARTLCIESERAFTWLLLELLCWTDCPLVEVDVTAQELTDAKILLASGDGDTKSLGRRIQQVLEAKRSNFAVSASGPGGRHDNDMIDYRKIAVFPTNEELMCAETSFYRRADTLGELEMDARLNAHLDNQFRLLREDFLAELREDVGAPGKPKQARRRKMRLRGLALVGIHTGRGRSKTPCALALSVKKGLEALTALEIHDRKDYLRNNARYLKHQSFGCIMDGEQIVSFATLLRIEDALARETPLITLRAPDEDSLKKLLMSLKMSKGLDFVLMDTPVFAYEPILTCLQSQVEMPLWKQLLSVNPEETAANNDESSIAPTDLIEDLEDSGNLSIQDILELPKPVQLDESQMQSLLSGLRQAVSLIQGPPGEWILRETFIMLLDICY